MRVAMKKVLLYVSAFGVDATKTRGGADLGEETFFFDDILAYAVIGIHPHEQLRKTTCAGQRCCYPIKRATAAFGLPCPGAAIIRCAYRVIGGAFALT